MSVMRYTTAPYHFLSFVLLPRSAPLSSPNSPHSLFTPLPTIPHSFLHPTFFCSTLLLPRPPLSLKLTLSLHHPTLYPFSLCKGKRGDISTSNKADWHSTIVQGELAFSLPLIAFILLQYCILHWMGIMLQGVAFNLIYVLSVVILS